MQWAIEHSLILAGAILLTALASYLLAAMRAAKQISSLEAQLSQASKDRDAARAEQNQLALQLKDSEDAKHNLEKDLGTTTVKLNAANEKFVDAINQRDEARKAVAEEQQKLEALQKRAHEAEKQLENAQTDVRSLSQQLEDIKKHWGDAREELKAERQTVSDLKDQNATEGKKARAAETAERDAREQLEDIKQQLAAEKQSYKALLEDHQNLKSDHTELKTSLEKREEHFKEQLGQLAETKQSFTKEFENLANRIFEEKGKTFTDTSKASIDGMLKPFREQIEGFQKRINEVHESSVRGNSDLNAEIKKVLEVGLKMSAEATNLTSALKGDAQQRGAWGEAQLRRTLEMSGLVEDAHYEVQSAFKDAEGKQKQTDYLIKLPDSKHIIIDSKVSLVAYDRAVAAEGPEEYQLAMAEHVKAVRKHIDDLASKDYTNLVGMRSPSFVLMFMPIEPAYIEALKSNKDLFEYGYKKNIVLVSHTTLIPILRTVSNLWMIERSNAEAREISEKAGDIYNQVCIVADRLNKLGGTLSTVSNHYNNTVKALAGQQGLHGKVERFSQLSAKVSKSLPKLEPAHMDFETERLSLIVEAIEEPQTDHPTDTENHTEAEQSYLPQPESLAVEQEK
ncbi:MAG: DNA recombination protein RmuC [Pseudomonadota bacterium]|nr:DNA recombination protein RmuC [Pseudomonadota bacterium]